MTRSADRSRMRRRPKGASALVPDSLDAAHTQPEQGSNGEERLPVRRVDRADLESSQDGHVERERDPAPVAIGATSKQKGPYRS